MSTRIDLSLNWTDLLAFVDQHKDRLYTASNGKQYLSLTMWQNEVPDQKGNDFSVKPRATKQEMDARTRLPFVGNAKFPGPKQAPSVNQRPSNPPPSSGGGFGADDDMPFAPERM